jgi:hypothetical protein
MMQMLAAGGIPLLTDGLRQPDPDNPRGYFEYEPVKATKRDASWVPLAEGKAVKMVYALLRELPPAHHYRVILMRRDLNETLASQRAMLRRSGQTGAALSDEKLAALFARELDQVKSRLKAQKNFDMIEVEHRACLAAPAEVAAMLNAFLGGGLNEAAMTAVIDPALYRQRSQTRTTG